MKMLDGSAQLAPIIHTNIDIHQYSTLGQIISHGYFCCGFFPTRLEFPVLTLVLLGCSVSISQVRSFVGFMSHVERKVLTSALVATEFSNVMKTSFINLLSRFGCREVSSPEFRISIKVPSHRIIPTQRLNCASEFIIIIISKNKITFWYRYFFITFLYFYNRIPTSDTIYFNSHVVKIV